MRKYLLLLICVVICGSDLAAQELMLSDFNVARLDLTRVGMIVLGAWAVTNMLVGAVMLRRELSGQKKHFYRMNIFWNLVNLALAGFGLYGAVSADPASFSMTETLNEFNQMGKLLIFNGGLDVAYITGGFLMMEMSKNRLKKQAMLSGYGRSLILQGAFLLLFDLLLFALFESQNQKFMDLLHTVSGEVLKVA